MSVSRKAVLSFLLVSFLVVGIAALAYTSILEMVEIRFYNPAVREALVRQTARDAALLNGLLLEMQGLFASSLDAAAVSRSFLLAQDAADVDERSRVFGMLAESVPSLQSVWLVDSDGIRVHFSARGYHEDPPGLPFDDISCERAIITVNMEGNRLIFSYPFRDDQGVRRGMALFSVSARVLTETLDDYIALVAMPAGFILGPSEILPEVSAIWAGQFQSIAPLFSANAPLALVSVRMDTGFYFGRVINETVLIFSQPLQVLLFLSIFFTLFLIVFFLLNARQDYPAHIQGQAGAGKKSTDTGKKLPFDEIDHEDLIEDNGYVELEELEVVERTKPPGAVFPAGHGGGLLAAAMHFTAGGESPVSPSMPDTLEDISGSQATGSMVNQLFSVPSGDPELLSGISGRVIVEQSGIPYINSSAVNHGKDEEINGELVKLVESVVGDKP